MNTETLTGANLDRPPWAWRLSSWLATLIGVVVLGIAIAYWGWHWFGPAPTPPAPPASTERGAREIIAAQLFGRAPVAATPSAAQPAPSDMRLLGVFAEKNGRGYALFRFADRGPVLVRAGQELMRDVTVVAVRPEGVRLSDRGTTRDITLRTNTAPAARTVVASAAPRRACTPPPGFKGLVYRLNAELLTGIASRPESWTALLTPGADGLTVREGAAIATMLGMKAGDRMVQANGIALTGIDDVMVSFVNPLIASEPVVVSGVRDGKSLDWLFLNAGACPG
jgi:hypothetical protein